MPPGRPKLEQHGPGTACCARAALHRARRRLDRPLWHAAAPSPWCSSSAANMGERRCGAWAGRAPGRLASLLDAAAWHRTRLAAPGALAAPASHAGPPAAGRSGGRPSQAAQPHVHLAVGGMAREPDAPGRRARLPPLPAAAVSACRDASLPAALCLCPQVACAPRR